MSAAKGAVGPSQPIKVAAAPIVWRGITITTPYFAAVDLNSTSEQLRNLSTPQTPCRPSTGLLDALRFYRISGWSHDEK